MDPEQRLFIIHEHFAVKINVFFLCALARTLAPQRMSIAQRNRAFHDLRFLFRFSFFAFFYFFRNMLYDFVCVKHILLIDRFILRLRICFGKEDFNRHKRTIFFNHFSCAVFICKRKTVFI